MSDQDIIDTIAASLHKSHIEGIISFRGEAVSAFAALLSAGYAIVKKDACQECGHARVGVCGKFLDCRPGAEADQLNAPKRYRKKPAEIEAMQLTRESFHAVGEWAGARECWGLDAPSPGLFIETLEGLMKASLGDYVIRGVKGEFYPCKPDIFAATYVAAEADQ